MLREQAPEREVVAGGVVFGNSGFSLSPSFMTIRVVRYVNDKPTVSHIGFITDIGMSIHCDFADCPTAYRLDYTASETNLDIGKLRREATAKVDSSHPNHPDVIVLKS